MDNMLYIIAGLVIISVIAVLVVRKNKAQKPTTQVDSPTKNNTPSFSKQENRNTPAQSTPDSVTKFDSLTIAQRFMDQQRYDKAIETLERGLVEKPKDNQLLLKLLNIHALTDQNEAFLSTYNAIKIHGDAATIQQAQQLKDLLDTEQNQDSTAVSEAIDNQSAFESIDFDISTKKANLDDSNAPVPIAEVSDSPEPANPSHISDSLDNDDSSDFDNDTFDLTLDDLEQGSFETTAGATDTQDANIIEDVATHDDKSSNSAAAPLNTEAPASTTDTAAHTTDNIDDDFTLDFDLPVEDTSENIATDSDATDLNINDDDFVLDFDDLVTEADSENEHAAVTSDSIDDDFTLFLEEQDHNDVDETHLTAPTHDSSLNTDLEDIDLDHNIVESSKEDTPVTLDILSIDDDLSTATLETPTTSDNDSIDFSDLDNNDNQASSVLTFDDNTLIDDDFDFSFDEVVSTPTSSTPVTTDSDSFDVDNVDDHNDNTSPTADFAAQFAADFGFVKTLDNNQVTLDLASQYLKLGEYDSAKRLLNEVMTQGSSEQQTQAQALLARSV